LSRYCFTVLARKLENVARINLTGQRLGDSGRIPSGNPRIEAMNHHSLEICDDLAKFQPGFPIIKIRLAADDPLVERFNGRGHGDSPGVGLIGDAAMALRT
jgi:hypothetical protein